LFPFPVDPHVGIPAQYAERRATCPFGKVRLPSGDEAVLLVTYRDSAAAFTPRRIERWKPTIAAVAGELIDTMERTGPPADLVADYCFQLPVRIICKLLGVPERDLGLFRDWSNAFVSAARMEQQERGRLIREFSGYTA